MSPTNPDRKAQHEQHQHALSPKSQSRSMKPGERNDRFEDIEGGSPSGIHRFRGTPKPIAPTSQSPLIQNSLFGAQQSRQTGAQFGELGASDRYNFPPLVQELSRTAPGQPIQASQESPLGANLPIGRNEQRFPYRQAPAHLHEYQDADQVCEDAEGDGLYHTTSPDATSRRPISAALGASGGPTQSPNRSMVRDKTWPTRKRTNHDEFDGEVQLLPESAGSTLTATEEGLPSLPTHLKQKEQEAALNRLERCLCECAFKVMAKYQFPIPIEEGKQLVDTPYDRTWNEWAYMLKRLATKRRIPARVLFEEKIKNMITVLENSLDTRPAAGNRSRALKDDRYILQMISAGIQVAKIFMDGETMEKLSDLYEETEAVIQGGDDD